nr:PREDICTED: probable cytochrome P450 6a14 [Linepithema humile]
MMESWTTLCGIAIAILLFYYYFTSTFNFWKSRGVRGPRPIPIFGNIKNVMLGKKFIGDYLTDVYNDYKDEPLIGIFAKRTPILIVNNPEFIKDILIKDFSTFCERGVLNISKKNDPLTHNLLNLEYKNWKPLRKMLTPIFTSGKLKKMFPLILECADHLEQNVKEMVNQEKLVECRELTAKYTTDVIGICAFGIDINALSDENSEFRKMGKAIVTPSWSNLLWYLTKQSAPWLYDILANVIPESEATKFFSHTALETINHRQMHNIIRHDFIDILIELKNRPDKFKDIELTDSLLAAQAFLFFVTGFEGSSTTMSFALYELALNQKIQDKLHEEIDEEYTKHGSDLIYDNINKMTYLDKVYKETLRKYPPVTAHFRKSTSNYTFRGTNVNIPKGQEVWIPIYAIQQDPNIYPEPDVFNPERFNEENTQTRQATSYLPFGDGPKSCIGVRFADYQIKVGIIKILRNYKVKTCEKTEIPINNPKAFFLAPKNEIYLKLTKID